MPSRTLSFKAHRMVADPKFQKEFARSYKVVRSYDIPYVAGYSKDAKTVFIDRHFKKMMDDIDVEPYVFVHEKTEKALIDVFGIHYQDAHKIATQIEKMTVEKDGINWKKYEKFVMDQYKHIYHEQLNKIPKELDLTPYQDEKEFKILKAMHAQGSSKKS